MKRWRAIKKREKHENKIIRRELRRLGIRLTGPNNLVYVVKRGLWIRRPEDIVNMTVYTDVYPTGAHNESLEQSSAEFTVPPADFTFDFGNSENRLSEMVRRWAEQVGGATQ